MDGRVVKYAPPTSFAPHLREVSGGHPGLTACLVPPSACYRGPRTQNCPKPLGEGAKGVTSWRKGLPRVFCTSTTLFCTSATLFAPVQQAFGPHTPKHLLHPLLRTLGNFEVSGPYSRHSGTQSLSFIKGILAIKALPGSNNQKSLPGVSGL